MALRKQGLLDLTQLRNGDSHSIGSSTNFEEVVSRARNAFNSGQTRSYEYRKHQLEKLLQLCEEKRDVLAAALARDLKKDKFEAYVGELYILEAEIKKFVVYLKEWMKPQQPQKPPINLLDKIFIKNDPRGVVLIIGAWNYPVQLNLMPLVGAIAAGNCVILKPSEISSATAKILAELIPLYLDQDCVSVVLGGIPETTELLKQKFDYIFYTGSANVGKIIRSAANEHLTPVTLELGGKSPVYIDDSADIRIATKRILWGKCLNAGQTCIAPDYILCSKEVQDKFINEAKKVLHEWYGENPAKSPDFCRIINDRNFKRICYLMKSGHIELGGDINETDKYISPTIITNIRDIDPIMQEEIFGPLLPIIIVSSPQEAIEKINMRDLPLTMYIFSSDKNVQNLFLECTSSGSVCVNDTLSQFLVDTLPFGGVGTSGIGAYHGKYSFDTFSHKKSCLVKDLNSLAEKLASVRYPPYNEKKLMKMRHILQYRKALSFSWLPNLLYFLLGIGVGAVITHLVH